MPVKYVCIVKGYSLSFSYHLTRTIIRENDIVMDNSADVGLSSIDDRWLSFGGKKFMCDINTFEKYFVDLASLRNKRIGDILND